jgi:DNA-binding CsgD family transcriptional regulator
MESVIESKNIYQFITKIHEAYFPDTSYNNYRRNVMSMLNAKFRFSKVSFVIFEDLKFRENYEPFLNIDAINIDDKVYQEYFNSCLYKIDIAYPKNIPSDIREKLYFQKSVFTINDIMDPDEYEKTDYYRYFLKKYNLYYSLFLWLTVNNEELGCIRIYRSKEEGPFNKKDIEICSIINESIALGLKNHLKIETLLNDCEKFSNYMENFPLGLIILDGKYNYIDSNNIAERIFVDAVNKDIKFFKEYFITNILPKINFRLYYKRELPDVIVDGDLAFKISKVLSPIGIKEYYNIYVIKTSDLPPSKKNSLDEFNTLSTREKEIIALVIQGFNNEEIAKSLFLSIYTVKTHIQNIYKKLGINSRISLVHKLSRSSG